MEGPLFLFVFPFPPIFKHVTIMCTGICKRSVSVCMCAHLKTLGRWTDDVSSWVTLSASSCRHFQSHPELTNSARKLDLGWCALPSRLEL